MKRKILFFIILLCIPFTVHGKMMKHWWEGAYDKNPYDVDYCLSDAAVYYALTNDCVYDVKKTTKYKKTTYDFNNIKQKELMYNKVYQRCLTTIPVGDVKDPDDMKKYKQNREKCEKFIPACKNDVMAHYGDKCEKKNYTEEEAEEAKKTCQENVYDMPFSDTTSGGTTTLTCERLLTTPGSCASHSADCNYCKELLDACQKTVEENTADKNDSNISEDYDKPQLDMDIITDKGCVIMGSNLNNLLGDIYKLIRGACIALVVVLGILDFLKAVTSDDAESMKKAGSKFTKRLILLVVLIILPYLIDFFLELIFGNDLETCLDPFK